MSENQNESKIKAVEEDRKLEVPEPLTESDRRILELEHLSMLQTNTIAAFQNRVYTLEMQIVELMAQIEFNNQHHDQAHQTAPPQ
jgi:hypothetical protein